MSEPVFRGDLFAPEDPARSCVVEVRIGEDALLLSREGGRMERLPLASAGLSRGGFDGLGIIVQGPDGTGRNLYLQVQDEAFLEGLQRLGPASLQPIVRGLVSSGSATRFWGTASFAVFVLLLVGGLLGLYFGSGKLADLAVSRFPVSAEASLGELTARSLTEGKRVLTDGEVSVGVNAVWARVLEGIEKSPSSFTLYLVDHSTVNALAAPGGHVVVFTGLLANLESGEELAGILAHECAHALRRHSLKRLVKTAGFSVAFSLLFGDLGGLAGIFTEFGKQLALLSYSRDDEREADEDAVKILIRAGIDPTRFPEFFRRMAKEEGTLGKAMAIVSTHPSHQERDARLKALFAAHGTPAVRPIAVDWKKLRNALSATALLGEKQPPATAEDQQVKEDAEK